MYQIILSNKAKKDLKQLDKRFQEKVVLSLRILKVNPFLGQKMSGDYKGSFRIKIPPIRIIYQIDSSRKIIWVSALGHRQGIYN